MQDPESLPIVVLKPREERRLRNGHLWIFSNEIARIEGEAELGSLVEIRAGHGLPLGRGVYNPHSLIAVRLTSPGEEALEAEWFRGRIQKALRLREKLFPGNSSYRLLHSESDGVPGVIADRFDSVIAVQIASAGMDIRRELLFDGLMEISGIQGIVERNDHSLREMEGLPERISAARGLVPAQIISDGILQYHVDPLGGQKTGFYLDQRENRLAMRRFMTGGRVLDLFSNDGGFALHARHSGAEEVVAVESSPVAMAALEANRELNGLGEITLRTTDVFNELRELELRCERFSTVIADPPPFARSRKHVPAARKRYVDLFARSLGLLEPEGFAFFSTCSHHIGREMFLEIMREAFVRAHRTGSIIEERGASPDHPVHPAMPETGYLHGIILRCN